MSVPLPHLLLLELLSTAFLKIRKSHIASLRVTRSAVASPHSGRKERSRPPGRMPLPAVNPFPENPKVAHHPPSGRNERSRPPGKSHVSHAVAPPSHFPQKSESRPSTAFRSQGARSAIACPPNGRKLQVTEAVVGYYQVRKYSTSHSHSPGNPNFAPWPDRRRSRSEITHTLS